MPVRVIWGKEDKWIPLETAKRLKEKLGAKNMEVMEGAGGRLGVELGWWLGSVS